MNKPPKLRKILNLLLQLLIFAGTYFYLYRQIFGRNDLAEVFSSFVMSLEKPAFRTGIVLVMLLMLANWSIEAVKWRYLVGKVEEVPFMRAFQAVLTGISTGSLMPNRVGEFFGRVFFLQTASRIEGILITMVGSISQLLVTIVMGSAALLTFIPIYLTGTGFTLGYIYYSIVTVVCAMNLILLALFFKLSFLSALKERILRNGLKRLQKFFRIFGFYHNREMATVIILSLLRYLVFFTQFFLLLLMFDVRIGYVMALVIVALIYLVMAVIPTITLTELGIRGTVAVYIFGFYFAHFFPGESRNDLGVLAASTVLWLVNLGLPALIGTIFVFRMTFFRKEDMP